MYVGIGEKSYPCMAYLALMSDKDPTVVKNAFITDFDSGVKLNPYSAFFVLNAHFRSTCSKYPIIAFKKKESAHNFIHYYGGDIRDFDFALAVANNDLAVDAPVIERRKHQEIVRGKAIFAQKCHGNQPHCLPLKSHDAYSLQIFLDNRQSLSKSLLKQTINVPLEAKCLVCGMFVHKYPKWTTQIVTKNQENHFFDGVKDMMKFYYQPSLYHRNDTIDDFTHIFVSDYYTLEKIEARNAIFVSGSDVYGPMGYELIPFKNKADALEFSKAHKGKKILSFDAITPQIIWSLD